MFQFRGLSDDPWANTQPDQPDLWEAISSVGSSIKSSFSPSVPGAIVTQTQATPSTTATTVAPIAKPAWYKTIPGMLAIAGGLFVGWKYGLPKLRK